MQRFRVKQWREIFEEVIVEAVDLAEAEQLADGYPDYIDAPVEVVKEVESTLNTEVEPIETTGWVIQFDDPTNEYSAESEQIDVEEGSDAKDKAIAWLGGLNELPYHYPLDIPEAVGEWKGSRNGTTDTVTLMRDLAQGAWLTLIEVYEPR